MDDVIRKVAEKNGVSEEEVRAEMKKALSCAGLDMDPEKAVLIIAHAASLIQGMKFIT